MDILQKKLQDNCPPGCFYGDNPYLEMIRVYGTAFFIKWKCHNLIFGTKAKIKIWWYYKVLRNLGLY